MFAVVCNVFQTNFVHSRRMYTYVNGTLSTHTSIYSTTLWVMYTLTLILFKQIHFIMDVSVAISMYTWELCDELCKKISFMFDLFTYLYNHKMYALVNIWYVYVWKTWNFLRNKNDWVCFLEAYVDMINTSACFLYFFSLLATCLVLFTCLVLSCLVLSCLVHLSCLVLSCLALSCLVLLCLVFSWFILSCLVLLCLVLPHPNLNPNRPPPTTIMIICAKSAKPWQFCFGLQQVISFLALPCLLSC